MKLTEDIEKKYNLSPEDARDSAAMVARLFEAYMGKPLKVEKPKDESSETYKEDMAKYEEALSDEEKDWKNSFMAFLQYAKEHPSHKPVYMDMLKFSDDLLGSLKKAYGDGESEAAMLRGEPGQSKEEKSIEAAEPKNAISSNVLGVLKDRRM